MLLICTSCSRHVRPSDPACPFCGGLSRREGPRLTTRATRAAMLFGTASAVVAGVACSDAATSGDGGTSATDGGVTPAADAALPDAAFDGPIAVDAAYGGGPPRDADLDVVARDAGPDGPIAVDAAYGGPPFDGGRD